MSDRPTDQLTNWLTGLTIKLSKAYLSSSINLVDFRQSKTILGLTIRVSTTELSFKITLEREKKLFKKNSALENQLKESRYKVNDLRIQQEKENESLQTEIKDLKETKKVKREKRHTRRRPVRRPVTHTLA